MAHNHTHDEYEEEELTIEDIAVMANDKVDALIDLLIEKGIIKEEELIDKLDGLYEESEEEVEEEEEFEEDELDDEDYEEDEEEDFDDE
ncbi:MAG: hypothetical protein QXS41_02205 [Candidatus Woesearchaeota archaeon]